MITTPVALDGPLLVTLIVNFTKSVTFTAEVAFEYLIISRLVTGSPVISTLSLLLDSLASISCPVTFTLFGIVPLVFIFAKIVRITLSLTFKLPM